MDAPPPPRWVRYVNDEIRVIWDAQNPWGTPADLYELQATNNREVTTTTTYTGTEGSISCVGQDVGSPIDVRLKFYINSVGNDSLPSNPVTFLCANAPDSPATPTLLLRSIDIVMISWEPPANDGGTPILGYSVLMKPSDSSTYTMIYNGTQNPATRSLSVVDFNGAPLETKSYDLIVRAYNWVGESPDTQIALTLILSVRANSLLTTLTGDMLLEDPPNSGIQNGMALLYAAVESRLTLEPRDAASNLLTVAESTGSNIFVQFEEYCLVTSNFKCDRVPDTDDILNGTQYYRMTENGDGTFGVNLKLNRRGRVTMSVMYAKIGGWLGEYFNNAFLQGVPALTRIDNELDFEWGTDKLTNEAADFVSVQWFGRIRPEYSEYFTFLVSGDDGFRITIDGVVVADRWDSCCDDLAFGMNMTANAFYDTLIEFKEL
jgi:hypothetical protein